MLCTVRGSQGTHGDHAVLNLAQGRQRPRKWLNSVLCFPDCSVVGQRSNESNSVMRWVRAERLLIASFAEIVFTSRRHTCVGDIATLAVHRASVSCTAPPRAVSSYCITCKVKLVRVRALVLVSGLRLCVQSEGPRGPMEIMLFSCQGYGYGQL